VRFKSAFTLWASETNMGSPFSSEPVDQVINGLLVRKVNSYSRKFWFYSY